MRKFLSGPLLDDIQQEGWSLRGPNTQAKACTVFTPARCIQVSVENVVKTGARSRRWSPDTPQVPERISIKQEVKGHPLQMLSSGS